MTQLKSAKATSETGGVILRIVIALMTLIVIGGAIYGVLYSRLQDQQTYHRKALEVSEYGLMLALEQLHNEPSWRAGFEKTPYDEGWYKVTVKEREENGKILLEITSLGTMRSSTNTKVCVLSREKSAPDSSWVRESLH